MTNFSFRIPTKIQIFSYSPIQSVLKAIDNFITPEISEEFIPSHYSEEKKLSLKNWYKLYNACDDNSLKINVIQLMGDDGFNIEAMELLNQNH